MNEPISLRPGVLSETELLAQLQSAGARERAIRAPEALQPRLEAAFARVQQLSGFARLQLRCSAAPDTRWAALAGAAAFAACTLSVVLWVGDEPASIEQATLPYKTSLLTAGGGHAAPASAGSAARAKVVSAAPHAPVAARIALPATPRSAGGRSALARMADPVMSVPQLSVAALTPQSAFAQDATSTTPATLPALTESTISEPQVWHMPIIAGDVVTTVPSVALQPPALSTQLSALAVLSLAALPTYAQARAPGAGAGGTQVEQNDATDDTPVRTIDAEPSVDPVERPAAHAWPARAAGAAAARGLV